MKKSVHKYEKISFYVVAHADDWQLFMQPNAYKDIISGEVKNVFIITTAGDAGLGERYWQAREEGCKSSVRFCLSALGAISEMNGSRKFAGHLIQYWSINNVRVYFFRMPDGNKDGSGFAASGFNSLFKLKEATISPIVSVDQSTFYNTWIDFTTALESIINFERKGISNAWISYLNPDRIDNPNDHSDHTATGQAIQNIDAVSNLNQLLFAGYSVGVNQTALSPADLFWKAGMFTVYEHTVYEQSGYSTLAEDIELYLRWCSVSARFKCFSRAHD